MSKTENHKKNHKNTFFTLGEATFRNETQVDPGVMLEAL